MSVNLTLVPVALAIRAFMGKDRFEAWVKSNQVRVPSNLETEEDLFKVLHLAGYDAEKWGSIYKTHIRGEDLWFFWEREGGKWVAVFSKQIEQVEIDAFIKKLESCFDGTVFPYSAHDMYEKSDQSRVFDTSFREEELLMQSLEDFGLASVKTSSGNIICRDQHHAENGIALVFHREGGDQPYSMEIKGFENADMEKIYTDFCDLTDIYACNVQGNTYSSVIEKLENNGLSIENEYIDESDNSIVLTLIID